MIGKPEWFKYRVFGWGVAPKTWQGYVYVAVIALLFGLTYSIGINDAIRPWIVGAIFTITILDVMHIMINLPKVSDERENYHQLIVERNCSFAAIAALIGVMLFQTYQNRAALNTMAIPFDYSILVVLGAMFIAKVASVAYVRFRM